MLAEGIMQILLLKAVKPGDGEDIYVQVRPGCRPVIVRVFMYPGWVCNLWEGTQVPTSVGLHRNQRFFVAKSKMEIRFVETLTYLARCTSSLNLHINLIFPEIICHYFVSLS